MLNLEKPMRILQINAGSKHFGGVSSFLMNVYKHIDTDSFQFDFLSPDKTTYGSVVEEIENLGGHVYELQCGNGPFKRIKLIPRLAYFLKKHHYDIVHINSGSPGFNMISLLTVKMTCKSKVIVHSHNAIFYSSKFLTVFYGICSVIFNKYADLRFSCSKEAGKFMFGRNGNFTVINNGIELERFRFDENKRKEIRDKIMSLHSEYKIIGFVGRLEDQKNPGFVISIFNEILKKNRNSFLWMVGDGTLKDDVIKQINQLGIENHISLLGERKDVAELMQGMDALLLPSKFEGLGIVAIEAQTAGLKVYASDRLPKETKIGDFIKYISLDTSCEEWAKCIISDLSEMKNDLNRTVKEHSLFDINNVCNILEEHYRICRGGGNSIVFGHIGRMAEQKNPLFVIDIFAKIHSINNNTFLWMVGDGPLRENVEQRIADYRLEDFVDLLGFRNDIPQILMGMDALIFPSFHEGLSIVTVEAQAAGLFVFASDTISSEHKISDKLEFISLSNSAEEWAEKVMDSLMMQSISKRKNNSICDGYSIIETVKKLEEIYGKFSH